MKIDTDWVEEDEYAGLIRSKLCCGTCSASTLLVWRKPVYGHGPTGSSIANIAIDDGEPAVDVCYLVRCSFFRFNVPNPDRIIHCEGFKEKRTDAK